MLESVFNCFINVADAEKKLVLFVRKQFVGSENCTRHSTFDAICVSIAMLDPLQTILKKNV